MKKILLIIAITLCIFQMVVLAIAIDIGIEAIDRGVATTTNNTYVVIDNPANTNGKITSIEIWANTDLSNVEVATFFVVSDNNLSTRDTEVIGDVTAGAKRTFTVDLDVRGGDYIGCFTATGGIEKDLSGFAGYWFLSGDNIPCTNVTFTFSSGRTISLYGTGETTGWPHKWDTLTIGKWNTKEFTKWNELE